MNLITPNAKHVLRDAKYARRDYETNIFQYITTIIEMYIYINNN